MILDIIIVLMIVMIIVSFLVYYYNSTKSDKESPIATKPVINYLAKFNGNKEIGRLIGRPTPVGGNMNLRKVKYRTTDIDEFGEESKVYETVIVHKDFMVETVDRLTVYPKNTTDLNIIGYEAEPLKEFINQQRDHVAIANGLETSRSSLETIFADNMGNQISQLLLKGYQELLMKQKESKEDNTSPPTKVGGIHP